MLKCLLTEDVLLKIENTYRGSEMKIVTLIVGGNGLNVCGPTTPAALASSSISPPPGSSSQSGMTIVSAHGERSLISIINV